MTQANYVHPIFNNRWQARQLKDFTSLRLGKLSPTDIDLYYEYKNLFHIIAETKFMAAPLKLGQRIALERLTDDLARVKPAICLVTAHDYKSDRDIDFGGSWITEFRLDGVWRPAGRFILFKDFYTESIKRFERGMRTWPDIG